METKATNKIGIVNDVAIIPFRFSLTQFFKFFIIFYLLRFYSD